MDKNQVREQINAHKKHMVDLGLLNSYFDYVEALEDINKSDFFESLIGEYFISSKAYMDELEYYLDTKPLDLANVERLIQKLKGGSASMGAMKLENSVTEMLQIFKEGNYDKLAAAFEKVKQERLTLKTYLEPYAELLKKLRSMDDPSDNGDDVESIDSNDVDVDRSDFGPF